MGHFEDLVRERLSELSTNELIAQQGRIASLGAFAGTGGDLNDPDAFNAWIVSDAVAAQHHVSRNTHTFEAWVPVPSLTSEAVEEIGRLAQLASGMRLVEDEAVAWLPRGRYGVRTYVAAMLLSQLYERLSPNVKQTGALPSLARLSTEDQAFLRLYHDARDSYEHWDERLSVNQSDKKDGRRRDRLVAKRNEKTISIGRASVNDGSLRLNYPDEAEVVVDFTASAAQRMVQIVATAEANIREGCSRAVVTFLDDNPSARWLATEFGHAIRARPFREPRA